MSEPTVEDAIALGLTADEYALVCEKLGRAPVQVELAMFSLMWSEHCSYKHSKKLLGTLPTEGEAVFMGPGENAGAVRVSGDLVCAFKVESHNHPSAVEPFQGAATGVGGILRDIFALGARPVAVLDALRFGEPTSERSRYLLDRAVAGIGHYGNSIGVPTIGGDVYFEGPYETNCLVNAMALGLAREEEMIKSAAVGLGNRLVLFGASTGRDGIGGASVLASAEFGEDDADKRPSVQVGDPFEEKKLLECSLELLARGLLVSLQDCGAAGLTSAASEMASKGEVGLEIDLDVVPLREQGMEPFEIMVSESQERMLCVCEPSRVGEVVAVCQKWEVHGTAIGTVIEERVMRILQHGSVAGEMPVEALVDDCPMYPIFPEKPAAPLYPAPEGTLSVEADLHATLIALLASPNLASRLPLFQQYDWIVQSRTVRRPGDADAAVLALPDGSALAASIDCNGRRVACDPYVGAVEAALECAANLACVGAKPLGTTNNLNFGNPERPEVAWQLTEAVRGLGDACRALEAPIVGGNVSLYNQGVDGPIYPTPVVGMVGALPSAEAAGRMGFAHEGDAIALVGWNKTPSLEGSELAKLRGEPLPDGLPGYDLDHEVRVLDVVREAVRSGAVTSAHDIAEGGLLVAIAECCLAGEIGADMDAISADLGFVLHFGERRGGFVLSGPRDVLAALDVPLDLFGTVGGDVLRVGDPGGPEVSWTLTELRGAHAALAPLFP
ncbi:MAG: phosphoribosylformylglycinamidine synthase subunit PurL [Solirubrobacterales bacterium]|nr:phosphoribosylformylglycinamidine synthase subunit PurL [Solirubrobacterales bacterium]